MDKLDRKILDLLQKDADLTATEIAVSAIAEIIAVRRGSPLAPQRAA